VEAFDKTLPLSNCHRQVKNSTAKLKDMVTDLKDNGTANELEIAITKVYKRHPELVDDPALGEGQEDQITKYLKTRGNRQIRGHAKPNSIKKSFLTSLEVPGEDELWR
jgi:hypothetical protein